MKDKALKLWKPLLPRLEKLRESREQERLGLRKDENDAIEYEYRHWRIARARMLVREAAPELTPRGSHALLYARPLTHRGPVDPPSRGVEAVFFIATGPHHICVIDKRGGIYAWGVGGGGRLGVGDIEDRAFPTPIDAFDGVAIRQVSCGRAHSVALSASGDLLYVWGSAGHGQLGIDRKAHSTTYAYTVEGKKVEVSTDEAGELYAPLPVRLTLPSRFPIRSISCGYAHTAAITMDGSLYVWGSGNGGRLGLGRKALMAVHTPTKVESLSHLKISEVACGAVHTIVATSITEVSGMRSCWKSHSVILLVQTSEMVEDEVVTRVVGGEVYMAGPPWVLGRSCVEFEKVQGLEGVNVCQLSAGYAHSGVITTEGEVFTWGNNAGGGAAQPLVQKFINDPTPVSCLRRSPKNLSHGRPTRQSSTFNMRHSYLAVDGEDSGLGEDVCTHTQHDMEPWWEVDLGEVCTIERIEVYNRRDVQLPPGSVPHRFSKRLFPCAVLLATKRMTSKTGDGSFLKAKAVACAAHTFNERKHLSTWRCPAVTVARFVR